MSIVGTRPPLISETNFYELHHRAKNFNIFICLLEYIRGRVGLPGGFGIPLYITSGEYYYAHNVVLQFLTFFGIYSIFMSWLEIFEIIITLRIYSNGYVAGLVRDDENRTTYTATMQSLSIEIQLEIDRRYEGK